MKNLLLVINEDRFFLSHRTNIAVNAAAHGWDVTLVTKDTGKRKDIEAMGFKYIELPVNPTGMNIFEEIKTMCFLYRLYKHNPNAIIHHVGLKNMLWGGNASRIAKSRGVLFAVSGLGTLFGSNNSLLISTLIQKFLKFGMNKSNVAVIFQNHEDESLFINKGIVDRCKHYFIKGSGVDLIEYSYSEPKEENPLIIIFTARMLKEKGVLNLVEAAEILREEYEGKVEFWLCGGLSTNPSALSKEEMLNMVDGKYIKWLGHRNDVKDLLRKSSIMCFPSYYREGVPKSLIEASAVGRPIITTNSVGCKDTVENGINGIIVPVKDSVALSEALRKLIDNADLRRSMGLESRKIAERDYDVNFVADMHLRIYESLNDEE